MASSFHGEPWRVDDARVVWGGVRFERHGEAFEVAGGFAAPLLAAVSTPEGWLFLSEDGLLARADAFLGPPEAIERWSAAGSVVPALERIVIGHRSELWTSDGHPMERIGLDAAFAVGAFRGDWGLVIGAISLYETRDGGLSWSALDLGGALPLDVALHPDGGFAVMRTDGPHRRLDGAWETASFPSDEVARVPEGERLALLQAAARLPMVRLDAAFLEALREQSREVGDGCIELAFAGPFAFARCSEGEALWWERRDGSRVLRIDVLATSAPAVSPDGRTALWLAPCAGGAPAPGRACVLLDERVASVHVDDDALVTVGGGHLLIEHDASGEVWERFVLVDPRTGREGLLRLSLEARAALGAESVALEDAAIDAGGRYVALSFSRESDQNRQLVLVAGDPSAPLPLVPLPIGAVHATVLPDGPLVVFGDRPGDLWWSPRGGRFRRIPVDLEGVVRVEPAAALVCGPATCRFGAATIDTGARLEPAMLGSGVALAGVARSNRRVVYLEDTRRLACDAPTIIAAAEPQGAVRSDQPEVRAWRALDGDVERWRWRPAGAREESATGPASAASTEEVLTVVRATGRYALVMRCTRHSCDARVLRGGRIEPVAAAPFFGYAAMPLDDGGTLVVARARVRNHDASFSIGWHFDASGSLAHSVARTQPLYLARWGGYGWAEAVDEGIVFSSVDGAQRRMLHTSDEDTRPCRDPLGADALLVRDTTGALLSHGEHELSAYPWLEVSPRHACVRGYDVHPLTPLDEWPSRIEAHAGGLRTIERGRRHVECRDIRR